MDAAHPERAREHYEKAGVTFVRGVDAEEALWSALDFDVVPNGIMMDGDGIVRYAKFGGFGGATDRDPDLVAIGRLIADLPRRATAGQAPAGVVSSSATSSRTGAAQEWFARGVRALREGRKAETAVHWRHALKLDPRNYVIRKQIWALEHPDQFYPAINFGWQEEQRAREGPPD